MPAPADSRSGQSADSLGRVLPRVCKSSFRVFRGFVLRSGQPDGRVPVIAAVLGVALACSLTAQMAPNGPGQAEALPEAEARSRAYLEMHEDAVEERYRLAYILFRENHPTESLAEYTRAAQGRRPAAKDLETVGLDYVLLGDYIDADKWMTAAVQMDERNATAWYELGRIKYTEYRFAEAVAAFRRSLEIGPRTVKSLDNLGLALEGLGHSPEAVSAYRQAIALQADAAKPSEQPLLNLGTLLVHQEQAAEALSLLTEAARIAPRNPKIREQLGRAYERLGRLPEAQASLEQAVALSPENSSFHFQLGQIYKREGKQAEAKVEFARVAALRGTKSDDAHQNGVGP